MTKGKQFAQEAADRLNAKLRPGGVRRISADYGANFPMFTAYCDLLAELAEAKDDLREIDRIAVKNNWASKAVQASANQVADIAAKYRETDPLIEAIKAADTGLDALDYSGFAAKIRAELDKRGLEVGVKS